MQVKIYNGCFGRTVNIGTVSVDDFSTKLLSRVQDKLQDEEFVADLIESLNIMYEIEGEMTDCDGCGDWNYTQVYEL